MESKESTSTFFFSRKNLRSISRDLANEFGGAQPFPHVVIDGIVPNDVLDAVLTELPQHGSNEYLKRMDPTEHKFSLNDIELMGPKTQHLLAQFNSAPFIEFVEALTGLDGLVPDPYFYGGGVHLIERGGFLKVHADFSLHPSLHIDRRLNAILYLNKDWQEEYGGQLELWDADVRECVKRIPPLFGRLVIFRTTGSSYHGHPEPLNFPEGMSRRSLALYYYTGVSEDRERRYTTDFHQRPGEAFKRTSHVIAYRWLPPVIVDRIKKWRRAKTKRS
jgi:hypothetical protein